MKFRIIAVGKIKDASISNLAAEYQKKICYDAKLEVVEIKDACVEDEGKKFLELLDKSSDSYIISLSEEGKECPSREFAKIVKQNQDKTIHYIIGGPFGLSVDVKKRSDLVLSLSRMTFTHEMARLFLLEQLYRSLSIIHNKKYHKD